MLHLAYFDTIAAISTPFGKGGVAVIRLSGPDALQVTDQIFRPKSKKYTSLQEAPARVMIYGDVISPEDPSRVLDDVLCVVFPAPHSFTGENVVEISCHGGVLVTRSVLSACLTAGARAAEAGEYTRRAYLNGKMNLPEAEALGNLLEAGNDEQMRLARAGMKGHLAREMEKIYSQLVTILANLEVGMDFPEEDLTEIPREDMILLLSDLLGQLNRLKDTYRTGHAIAEGVPTAIVGRPNAGKSALYNRLVGRDAAIVTSIAGTTRDVLSETVSLGRVTLRLSDTAGLRDTEDPVEQIGVQRAKNVLTEAELVLALFDGSELPSKEDLVLLSSLKEQEKIGKKVLYLLTKHDLWKDGSIPFLTQEIQDSVHFMTISSQTGQGMEDLTASIEKVFIDGTLDTGASAIVFSARQYVALTGAIDALTQAIQALEMFLPYDLCAEDLRETLSSLGELSGHSVREEVISEIFHKFCVGK